MVVVKIILVSLILLLGLILLAYLYESKVGIYNPKYLKLYKVEQDDLNGDFYIYQIIQTRQKMDNPNILYKFFFLFLENIDIFDYECIRVISKDNKDKVDMFIQNVKDNKLNTRPNSRTTIFES